MSLLHDGEPLSVLVCSDQRLVVDAVCAALVGHGLTATGLVGFDGETGASDAADHHVGVIVADLDDAAIALTDRARLPWLVVADTSELARVRLRRTGVATLPATTTVSEIVSAIGLAAERRGATSGPGAQVTGTSLIGVKP